MDDSNHKAIVFKLDFSKIKARYPFKFNHTWIEDFDFCEFFNDIWVRYSQESSLPLIL